MRVQSKVQAGFRQNGLPLLNEGENVLEEPLSLHEREFIDAMVEAGLVEILSRDIPSAPVSETKLTAAARVEPKRMRRRRAVAK